MTDSPTSRDIPVAPLPLSQEHRDELNSTILAEIKPVLQCLSTSKSGMNPDLEDSFFWMILHAIIEQTNSLLSRENLHEIIEPRTVANQEIFEYYPELRGLIRGVVQTHDFVSLAELREYCFSRYLLIVIRIAEMFKIAEGQRYDFLSRDISQHVGCRFIHWALRWGCR